MILEPLQIAIVCILFIVAGALEIAGGWLIWQAIREKQHWSLALLGSISLILYGFIVTLQPLNDFGRLFAAYGGIFIALSLLWAFIFDGFRPDAGDYIGALVSLIGAALILFWPRPAAA